MSFSLIHNSSCDVTVIVIHYHVLHNAAWTCSIYPHWPLFVCSQPQSKVYSDTSSQGYRSNCNLSDVQRGLQHSQHPPEVAARHKLQHNLLLAAHWSAINGWVNITLNGSLQHDNVICTEAKWMYLLVMMPYTKVKIIKTKYLTITLPLF